MPITGRFESIHRAIVLFNEVGLMSLRFMVFGHISDRDQCLVLPQYFGAVSSLVSCDPRLSFPLWPRVTVITEAHVTSSESKVVAE